MFFDEIHSASKQGVDMTRPLFNLPLFGGLMIFILGLASATLVSCAHQPESDSAAKDHLSANTDEDTDTDADTNVDDGHGENDDTAANNGPQDQFDSKKTLAIWKKLSTADKLKEIYRVAFAIQMAKIESNRSTAILDSKYCGLNESELNVFPQFLKSRIEGEFATIIEKDRPGLPAAKECDQYCTCDLYSDLNSFAIEKNRRNEKVSPYYTSQAFKREVKIAEEMRMANIQPSCMAKKDSLCAHENGYSLFRLLREDLSKQYDVQ